jgi:putative NADH-flavin reductase
MKIALIGATGFIGSKVLEEALSRGHQVTAICRDPSKITAKAQKLIPVVADVYDNKTLIPLLEGQDAVISAFNSGWKNPNLYADYKRGYASILSASKQAKVKHILVVGGSASLVLPSGKRIFDGIPDDRKSAVKGPLELLDELKGEWKLNWSFVSPPPGLTPDDKRGKFRLGTDSPVTDEKGESHLSVGDLAVAIVDEIEKPQFIHRRFTAGY